MGIKIHWLIISKYLRLRNPGGRGGNNKVEIIIEVTNPNQVKANKPLIIIGKFCAKTVSRKPGQKTIGSQPTIAK